MRRVLCVVAIVILGTASWATPTAAADQAGSGRASRMIVVDQSNPTTGHTLAGTTLEADARDDEGSPAPWLIGSAAAAAAAVAIGGSLLKRRMR